VVAQHRLLTEELGVERVRLVSSWSMGACQSYAWAALHPEMVDAIAPISGSARTANFNSYFPPVDSEYEAQTIPGAELRVIPTVWGHLAPFNPEDQAFIDRAIGDLPAG
jgi:pimeloyl-ACP methyl ester carboxylesterase